QRLLRVKSSEQCQAVALGWSRKKNVHTVRAVKVNVDVAYHAIRDCLALRRMQRSRVTRLKRKLFSLEFLFCFLLVRVLEVCLLPSDDHNLGVTAELGKQRLVDVTFVETDKQRFGLILELVQHRIRLSCLPLRRVGFLRVQ